MQFVRENTEQSKHIQIARAEHKDGTCFHVVIGFATNRHELNDPQKRGILKHLDVVRDPGLILEMYGEADPKGDPGYNMMLSEKRMKAVQRFMQTHGVSRDKFTPELCKALGEFFENARGRPDNDPIGRTVRYFVWPSTEAFLDGLTSQAGKLLAFGRAFPISS
jgi:hypothetical protein